MPALESLFFGSILLHAYGGSGILSGFLHPLLGLEHLLAMVAIGFVSAIIGGRAIWSVPAAFVGVMLLGAFLGLANIEVPLIDVGITASIVVLGVGILAYRGMPEWAAITIAGIFGFFHGVAHGLELPAGSDTVGLVFAYVSGFIVATIGLHVVGALLGMIFLRTEKNQMYVRVLGGAIAAYGVYLFSGALVG